MDDLSVEEFASFVREHWSVPARKQIAPETQFERDLGLTGDDGLELLKATEKRYGVSLCSDLRQTFHLGSNEYLFHSEGLFPFALMSLFNKTLSVRKFTVGELYEAVRKKRSATASDAGKSPATRT